MDFGAMIPALISGKVDMIGACITITAERSTKVLFLHRTIRAVCWRLWPSNLPDSLNSSGFRAGGHDSAASRFDLSGSAR
jgi:hypothetical protein